MRELEEIYTLYYGRIYALLLRMSASRRIAEELTEETFYKAIKSIGGFDGRCDISAWLCKIARNEYLNYIKRSDNRCEALPEDDALRSETDIERFCEDAEQATLIRKILHCLDEPYKEVFTLRVMGELKFSQIGEIFEKSEVWARVTFYRAKEKILRKLEE